MFQGIMEKIRNLPSSQKANWEKVLNWYQTKCRNARKKQDEILNCQGRIINLQEREYILG